MSECPIFDCVTYRRVARTNISRKTAATSAQFGLSRIDKVGILVAMIQISDLEAAVLCVLRRTGGCTPYHVRQVLAQSPTPRFSGSTGAIYPLIRRLERQGMVAIQTEATGRRTHRICKATTAGKGALRRWILQPNSTDFGIPFDPILTRVNMLGAVSPGEARTFLATTIEGLEASLEGMKPAIRELADADPPYSTYVGRCFSAAMRARIKWLRSLLSEVS